MTIEPTLFAEVARGLQVFLLLSLCHVILLPLMVRGWWGCNHSDKYIPMTIITTAASIFVVIAQIAMACNSFPFWTAFFRIFA